MNFNRSKSRRREPPERWQRENDAPRLAATFTTLQKLRLDLTESRDGQRIAGTQRTLHIIVERASTHFEVPCGDPRCADGGHDISYEVMRGLSAGQELCQGEHWCAGYVADRSCGRQLHFSAVAKYEHVTVST